MSSGSAFGSSTALVIVAGVWAVLGVALYQIETYANGMQLPQDAYNFINIMNYAWVAVMGVFLILIVINHWLNSKSDASMGV